MYKRILSAVIAFLLVPAMTACGDSPASSRPNDSTFSQPEESQPFELNSEASSQPEESEPSEPDDGAPPVELTQELGYFVYPGLDWAMPEDEVFEALGVDKASCEMKEDPGPDGIDGTPISVTRYYDCESEFLGDPVSLQLTFIGYRFSSVYRLQEIGVLYPDETTMEDFFAICEKVKKMVEEQGVPVDGPWMEEKERNALKSASWKMQSTAKCGELPDELRMKYKRVSDYMLELLIQAGGFSGTENGDDPLRSRNVPLSTITGHWSAGEVPPGLARCGFTFKGDEWEYHSYIDMYGELFSGGKTGGESSQQ